MTTFVCRDRLNIVLTPDGSRVCRPVIEGVKLHPAVDRSARGISHPNSARKGNRAAHVIDRQLGLSTLIDRRRGLRQEITRSPGEEAAEEVDLDPPNRVNAIQQARVRRGCR